MDGAGPLAAAAEWGHAYRSGLCPKRAPVVSRSTHSPAGATVICVDELGPVMPRPFPPAPGWSADGQRITAPLTYRRGTEKTWVYGALRVCAGQALTLTAPSRNTGGYQCLLDAVAAAHPAGDLHVSGANLASPTRPPIQQWLAEHPRVHAIVIPKGASWLNLQEAWWRLLRREAFAGQTFGDDSEIAPAAAVATTQLNARAKPWVWGRPPPTPRKRCRRFLYHL